MFCLRNQDITDAKAFFYLFFMSNSGYLNYLYSPVGQDLAAKYNFRPRNAQAAAKYAGKFPKIKLFTINDVFGGWAKAQKTHFVNGAIYDQISAEK